MLSKLSHLLLTIYRRAQDTPVQAFQDQILADLSGFVSFDASMWGTAAMKPGGIDIHSLHLYKMLPGMVEAYERVKHLDTAARQITLQPRATMAFSASTAFGAPEFGEMRAYCERFGQRHCLISADFNPRTQFGQWITLYRADAQRPFTPAEVEGVSHLAQHLMQALALNRTVNLERMSSDGVRENWAVAIADARGVIYHADARFRDLIGAEWPCSADGDLPRALVALLARPDSRIIGQRVVVERTLEHEVLFLKARLRQAVDSLSARELMVARMLSDGLTQKQVAARLARSPETIRSQARIVFEKLDINSVVLLAPHLALR